MDNVVPWLVLAGVAFVAVWWIWWATRPVDEEAKRRREAEYERIAAGARAQDDVRRKAVQDVYRSYLEGKEPRAKSTSTVSESVKTSTYGPANLAMVCPHCQAQGHIRTKTERGETLAYCDKCKNRWTFR